MVSAWQSIGSRRGAFVATAAYLLAPGHPDGYFKGIPLGLWPLVVLTIVGFIWVFFRGERSPSVRWTYVTAVLWLLLGIKLLTAAIAPPVGWLGRYYPNDRFSGPFRRSTEFLRLHATRIDRAIDFHDDWFPVYFLNEADFNRGIRREVTLPVTAEWMGHVRPTAPATLPLALQVRGSATVTIDGQPVLNADGFQRLVARTVVLTPGDHEIVVSYLKPANTDPLIEFRGFERLDRLGGLLVTPSRVPDWRRMTFWPSGIVALAADIAVIFVFSFVFWRLVTLGRYRPAVMQTEWRRVPSARMLCALMFVLFVAQGIHAASPLQHRAVSLSGGDDWLAFEARAREVITGGLLMRFGQPLGAGEVFYYYPGYSYFLAAVHWLGGEDLSTPIFAHFILLFAANVVIYFIASAVFDRRVAIAAVLGLIVIEEVAFVRHYTVTLLSENLYVLTVALTVFALVRFIQAGRRAHLAWSGLAGGVSAVIRPAMMLYMIPALVIVLTRRPRQGRWATMIAAGVLLTSWFAVLSLTTLRNQVVAGTPVLISESPAHSFILYNLPPTADAQAYMNAYSGGLLSAARILARIVVDHPGDSFRTLITKLGFSFGLLHWMGGNLHPELVLASAGYLLALLFCSGARMPVTWPIHAFVVAHLMGLVLTMPSNYGYRLILPMYLFFPMFGSRLVADLAARAGRATHAAVHAGVGPQSSS